ncbi:MAG: class I SAM-dependent methyltransferase [Gemmatimonadota bacterium]|nr:class I SAM-dependent methyltransferase [Gemmatimonadota bacterium]
MNSDGESRPTFRDEFSNVAAQYAAYRPKYPDALFEFVASLPARRELAWDCGTGSGQAARALASFFTRVIATDASAAQLAHATAAPNIEYRVARAEESGLIADSVDLVTVAQALHWFDLNAFFAEVLRVVRARGALVVWGYGDARLDSPDLDRILKQFYSERVGPFWPPNRAVLDTRYRAISMPFTEVASPDVDMTRDMTLGALAGYVRTWSATQLYIKAHGHDPVVDLVTVLRPAWGADEVLHRITWPLWIRASVRW